MNFWKCIHSVFRWTRSGDCMGPPVAPVYIARYYWWCLGKFLKKGQFPWADAAVGNYPSQPNTGRLICDIFFFLQAECQFSVCFLCFFADGKKVEFTVAFSSDNVSRKSRPNQPSFSPTNLFCSLNSLQLCVFYGHRFFKRFTHVWYSRLFKLTFMLLFGMNLFSSTFNPKWHIYVVRYLPLFH